METILYSEFGYNDLEVEADSDGITISVNDGSFTLTRSKALVLADAIKKHFEVEE